jgi:hypothetical protein
MINLRIILLPLAAAASLTAGILGLLSPVHADEHEHFTGHIGVDVRDGSFVVGRSYKVDGVPNFDEDHKVFPVELELDDSLGYWISNEPGYAGFWKYNANPVDLVGLKLGIAFADSVWKWDGSGFAPAASERLRVINPNGPGFTESGSGPVAPAFWFTVGSDNWWHDHVPVRLISTLGDPNSPSDGIYLALLRIQSQDGSIGPSDVYAMVFNKGLSEEEHEAAMDWVVENVVPEPASLTALAGGLAGLIAMRRRSA